MTMLLADGGAGLTADTNSTIGAFKSAVSSGDTHDIQVELEALRQLYANLWDVEGRLKTAMQQVSTEGETQTLNGLETTIEDMFGPSIPGVDEATKVARDSVSGASNGLGKVLPAMHAVIVKNLQAVYDCYGAYLQADENGANELSSAAQGEANSRFGKANDATNQSVANGEIVYTIKQIEQALGF